MSDRPAGQRRRDGTPALPELLTVQDVARILVISRSRVYELIAEGELEAYRPGGRVRVPTQAVAALLARTKI
jgi:excisionase family DNA binding protein